MKKKTISIFLAVALLFSMLPQMMLSVNATELQKGDGWGNWSDYVLEETVVIYPVQGGNVYFGQMNPEWLDVDKTKIELLCADSTVTRAQIPETVNGLTVSGVSEGAFSNCTYLKSVDLPATIEFVWGSCFIGCTSLEEIIIAGGDSGCYTVDGVLYAKGFNDWTNTEILSLELYPAAKKDSEFAVPHGVTSISYWAFGDATNLRSISIPDSVQDIQSAAFGDWYSNVNFTDIYFEGSEEKWEEILVGSDYGYDTIESTLIHFNRYEPFAKSIGEDSAWNSLYYDYIVQDRANADSSEDWEWVTYELVYLNNDNIPELWITYQYWASGCRLVTIDENSINEELLSMGSLSYNERNNAFFHSGGKMDVYFDTVYKLEDGALITVAEGQSEVTWSSDGTSYSTKYFWNDSNVTEAEYTGKLNEQVNESTRKQTSSEQSTLYDYDGILDYLSTVEVVPDENTTVVDYARTEWINKHIEYANSDQYKTQVLQGFSGALDDALEDIKGNGMITAYNTLDSINTILDFDLDLTDVEEYELLLAQILFSRTGTTSINEIYDEYLSNNIVTICEILIENIPEMTSSEINEKVEKLKELLNTIKGLSRGDTQYNEVLSQIMDSISSFDDLNFGKEFVEAFDKAGLSFAADFLVSEIDTVENTLSEVIIYMAAGEAYCNTSDAFGDMILALRKHIAIPSDNPIFEPYQSDKMLVNDQMIWTKLGLKNAGNSIGPDPLNTPIYLSALAKAIENYYTQLEAAKAGNASVIAQNAMAEFATETADNLIDAELNVVVSLFECLPVVKQFSAIKALFDGTQFVIDTFTGIDDRAYLGTMVMRLYGIAYIHYLSVDNLATHTDAWGTITTFSPIEQKFDANAQFADAAQFDEAVAVYRAILSVATDYAEEYYTTYYEAADSILSKYPNYKPTIPPYVDTDSDTFKSVKQKIIELQMQKNDLAYEWCHSSKIIFNQLHGVNTYDSSEMLIYSFKCPVSVTFKNESGEIIATLSNGNSTVSAGYEQYFFTSEVISGSGEYVKIAAVPQSYEVVIEGTGTGRMDVSVSEYNDGQLGETKQYFGVPVSEDSSGYFGVKDEDGEDFCLIMDDTAYAEGDYSNIELGDGNKMTLYIAIVAIGVVCVGLAVIILKRKKSPK